MSDVLIQNGLVIDGAGAPARRADLRVKDGRIVEIAPQLAARGETLIDAAGACVTPGFIDSHTHYDATIFWDPMCDPMPQHGVTTVVIGNCSLGLAPIRAQDRTTQLDTFSYIEDIPLDTLNNEIPWTWETYQEFTDIVGAGAYGVNLAAFVGHGQLRAYVMGDASWERAAAPAEIAAIAAELEKALKAGAFGMSFSFFDKDRKGRPVPSCLADAREMEALCAVLGRYNGTFQFVARANTAEAALEDLRTIGSYIAPHNVTALYNTITHLNNEPTRSARILACLEELQAKGIKLYAMATPRPFERSINFFNGLTFMNMPTWLELVLAAPGDKAGLARDPAWRARARHEVDTFQNILFPFEKPEQLFIGGVGSPSRNSWIGKTVADIQAARGGHVADAMIDWLIEDDFKTVFSFAIANSNPADVVRLIKHPRTFVSASDAGAHLQTFAAVGDSTLLLTRYVRERNDMTLEEAVRALTGHQAQTLGISDRGVLAPGMAADIAIFALDELDYGPATPVSDVPGGHSRLTRRPGGYRYTLVDGVVVQERGKLTGERPARWLSKIPA
jgi:N-acyl-D-aspartate/D-glutamate deacylase